MGAQPIVLGEEVEAGLLGVPDADHADRLARSQPAEPAGSPRVPANTARPPAMNAEDARADGQRRQLREGSFHRRGAREPARKAGEAGPSVWTDACTSAASMQPYIEVKFEYMAKDASVEASAHRWVGRLGAAGIFLRGAFLTVEPGRRGSMVCLKLELVGGAALTVLTSRDDVYVAVADAFRTARRQLLECTSGPRSSAAVVFAQAST